MPQLELSPGAALGPALGSSLGQASGAVGLFHDAAFPVGPAALETLSNDIFDATAWKRPHELSPRPRLFVDGAGRNDIIQGVLGDCWFLSACIAVAQHPALLWQIIPHGQVLFGAGYTGMVTFRFWRLGRWEKVRIDDRLPVDGSGQLLYARSSNPDEFWVPLLEKAFAKFHGGYGNLVGGRRMEGLLTLTGYVVEETETTGWDDGALFDLLQEETQRGSLATCSAAGPFRKGLAGDHSYSVTGARRVRMRKGAGPEVLLVRVRNPFGCSPDAEWSGAWRDGDSRWNEIDQPTKDSMQYKIEEDGEFWMEDNDFSNYFSHISFAMKTPLLDGIPMNDIKNYHVLRGIWKKGFSAGGSQKDMKKFATNPQYSLTVTGTDDSYIEGNELVDFCNIVLEIIQDQKRKENRGPDPIAVFIYKVPRPRRHRLSAKELSALAEFGEPAFHEARAAVLYRLQLPPGAYVLVASAFEAGRSRAFVLRAHSRRRIDLRPLHAASAASAA